MKGHGGNFHFLEVYDAQLVRLGALAERYFADDPNTCLIKLRQFAELLAQQLAARMGLFGTPDEPFADLLQRLKAERAMPREAGDIFHQLRIAGNQAAHANREDHAGALTALKLARQLAIWFHKTIGHEPGFKPGPFIPPTSPQDASSELSAEIARLKSALEESQSAADRARADAERHAREKETAEDQARREAEERALWEQLANEAESHKLALAQELATLQKASEEALPKSLAVLYEQAETAARAIDLDELATRALIDQQLRQRGWIVDSRAMTYAKGARPVKGQNTAIAEWPTATGPADYALFTGTTPIGVVEAKRQRKNVSAALTQSERYSKGIKLGAEGQFAAAPWGEFKVPFLFATNGRPYLKQIETESGIWFRDARKSTNHARALADWFTPEGLKAELDIDRAKADEALKSEPFNFGFSLRPYQKDAIQAIETKLAEGRREMLAAMATGTGKTKLAIALLYRVLAANRFRRVCFIVDRSALGNQTKDEFTTTKVVGVRAFADIFGLKGLEDINPDLDTRVHICTIQGLVKRVLYASDPADVPPIDQYDLMLVDECHRGYLLDRELSDAELGFRNQDDYVSKYRRVLEHFDAVKVGLTATPALHTAQIFGDPIYTYSYREAVIDGYLIDHEPPFRIRTQLSDKGIIFKKDDNLDLFDAATGTVHSTRAPDEIAFEVEEFNKKVITVPFNAVVCEELVNHIDPGLPGKTLIFAATDAHADIVVEQLKKAYVAAGIPIEDGAIKKLTGSVDKVQTHIRSFRNDANPKIAVTVDLLTTGIDVPSITNLVFLRRVNSRILYEQMLGRATRLCPDIGKETFRIFDAVDLYANLQAVTAMKPVVVNPQISLTQLMEELAKAEDDAHREFIRDQLIVKLRRRLRKLPDTARAQFEAEAGEAPEATLTRIQQSDLGDLVGWVRSKPRLGPILDWNPDGPGVLIPISEHDDQLKGVSRGYGDAAKPEDFLDNFTTFVRTNLNKIAALTVVVQRPRDLTRQQLRELKLELDRQQYSETNLRQAWKQTKNEDIAASIIGFVRQAALKEPLMPYEQRVERALATILKSRAWTDPQRQWLQRIGEQLKKELVVDRQALDDTPFAEHGGFNRLNKQFNGELETILSQLSEELWQAAS
ncbi:type I restriction-modification system endonuclease [Phreatobacter sp.]|uniref:type I restriction-modification system endonuclease n=1 Tax=Phreatobacter sp. TaxID=1966341 RepID=UPI0022C3D8C9|nr:type I restriction-modification system endonuclease [Phreatobacter sp.]MCZ8314395.1 type I restriction-modification system endonuclease [Phreatobacter sp.]